MELRARRRRTGETVTALHHDIRRLMALAYPNVASNARESIACDYFVDALDDADFALKVRERAPASLDDALRIALQLEAWLNLASKVREGETPQSKVRMRAAAGTEGDVPPAVNKRLDRLEMEMRKQFSDIKQSMGNRTATVTATAAPQENAAGEAESKVPRSFGERAAMPPWAGKPRSPTSNRNTSAVCWRCGEAGHIRRNCPLPHTDVKAEVNKEANLSRPSSRVSKGLDQTCVYVKMYLKGKELPCLLDSGSETTLIPQSVFNEVGGLPMLPYERRLWAANGSEIEIAGRVVAPFHLGGHCFEVYALILPEVEEVMIGVDWLVRHKCLWDFGTGNLYIDGRPVVVLSRKQSLRCRRVYTCGDVVVPPRREVDVTARSTLLTPVLVGPECIVDSQQMQPGLYVGRTLMPSTHRDVKVRVVNTTVEPVAVKDGTFVGNLVPVEVVRGTDGDNTQSEPEAREGATEVVTTLLDKLPTDFTLIECKHVSDMLFEYNDIFSRGALDMGCTTLVEHSIDTGNSRPIRQPLRRHPVAHLDIIDKQVDELIQHDIVQPAASPWASNVVLVRKKDGSFRLCVDYRAVNAITYKDTYPLPHIDTCLGSMDGAVYYSTLDLRSGYHNIPIARVDKDKTAFITRRGCFRYKRLPFGLTTAPSVFQRLMDLALCGLTYFSCLVYLDDIIVFAKDFSTHMQRLREVFERLRKANLKLHVNKCFLFQRKVSFLGHVLSEAGIEVQQEKVAAVKDWPTPKNLSELRSYLGLCSYYRRFIANFADIAAPLHALQRKGIEFKWGREQDDAFQLLKERHISAPILGMPTDEGTYVLDTDASDVGLGSVLSQRQGEREVVIAYASRTLSKPEHNYDVTKRELLAIVFGLRTYRQYLLGKPFVIRTDHSALRWLRTTPEPMAQLARWLTFIEQFSFEIEHRAGVRHGNADGLSRRPTDEGEGAAVRGSVTTKESENALKAESLASDAVGETTLAQLQMNDPDIGPIARLRSQQTDRPRIEAVSAESPFTKRLVSEWETLEVIDGLLYRRFSYRDGRPDALQLLVPRVKRKDFLERTHAGMGGGHLGVRRTLDQVRRRAFWPGWRRDVRKFVRQCVKCNGYFRGKLPRTGPLQPMLTGAPFERLHLDLTGPHPRSRRGSVFIISVIDPFSKWAECFPAPNKEANTIARILVEQVICRFGVPLSLLTDNTRELGGDVMTAICHLLGVEKLRTTVYKASTNAAVERFHRTLNSMLGRMIEDNEKDWDMLLPYVMAAYRSSRHEATGFTPNYLLLGREVHAPVDLVYETPEVVASSSYEAYSDELENRFQYAYALVRDHLGEAAKRSKRYYDLHVRPRRFSVGDWVYYYNPRKYTGKQEKWARKYSGPYLVVKVVGPVNVVLQKTKRSKSFMVHVDKVKPYEADELPRSWLDEVNDDAAAESKVGVEELHLDWQDRSGSDTVAVDQETRDLELAETGVKQRSDEVVQSLVEAERAPAAMAGVPPVSCKSPRPHRTRRLPQRYLK